MTIDKRLKEIRTVNKLSQNELSAMCGIPASIISLYENGRRKPSADNLFKLCSSMNVSSDYVLGLPKAYLDVNSAKIREITKILNW